MLDSARAVMFDAKMSEATRISGGAVCLATVGAFITQFDTLGEVFNTLWLLAVLALLVSVALDVRRKRYWGLAVVAGVAIVSTLGFALLYIVAHAIVIG